MNDYIYSLTYNGSYIGMELLIIIAVLQVPQVQTILKQMQKGTALSS